jgi:hypothetical protein
MTTRKLRARNIEAGQMLVEQDTGPRGGNGKRVGRPICEVHVDERPGIGTVHILVKVGDFMEPRGPFGLKDELRVVA